MNKYINALNVLGDCKFCKKRETCTERRGRHTFCWEIDEKFTVDVVEAVRCKDCKYAMPEGRENVYICKAMTNPNYCWADDYCSCGERKETE